MSKFLRAGLQILREEGLGQLFKRFKSYVALMIINKAERAYKFRWVDEVCFEESKRVLYRLMSSERSIYDISSTAFNYWGMGPYRSILPRQIPSEIESLARRVKKISPHTLVEIGTADGGSLYIFSRYLNSCQRIIGIDVPDRYSDIKENFFRLFDDSKQFYFLRGDSHSNKTGRKLSEILKQDKIDFLFIDGDHSYEGVKRDFNMYKQFVSTGGIIAFHDIVHPRLGVIKFWNEIKHQYHCEEIIASKSQVWCGIGIIYWLSNLTGDIDDGKIREDTKKPEL